MNPAKKAYLQRIRRDSAYPTFRILVNFVSGLFLFLGTVGMIAGMGCGYGVMADMVPLFKGTADMAIGIGIFIASILGGIVTIIIGSLIGEICSILVDMADSLVDLHSRYEQG